MTTGSTVRLPYQDRRHAGRVLAEALSGYAERDQVLVLGLPRGGAIVAAEVARRLGVPLDVLVVRKLGLPGQEELAMGALASGGLMVLNRDVADTVSDDAVLEVASREHRELERRERAYRSGRAPAEIEGRPTLLVDDGLATGSSMRAAIASARQRGASEVIVAVPVAPPHTVNALRAEADDVICPATPELFFGLGQFYVDFAQASDQDVKAVLESAWDRGEPTQHP